MSRDTIANSRSRVVPGTLDTTPIRRPEFIPLKSRSAGPFGSFQSSTILRNIRKAAVPATRSGCDPHRLPDTREGTRGRIHIGNDDAPILRRPEYIRLRSGFFGKSGFTWRFTRTVDRNGHPHRMENPDLWQVTRVQGNYIVKPSAR
jgi:hypothetical protein